MSDPMPILRRLWRIPLVVGWLLIGLLLTACVAIGDRVARNTTQRYRNSLTCLWMRGLIGILPLRIHRHGTPAKETALLVSNHVSWLDIVAIGAQSPVHFLSKAEVRHWPVVGWLASAAGTQFIQRGQAGGQTLHTQLRDALEQGESLVIFAEGTTTVGDRVRAFHGRLMSCAIESQTPLQPVAIAYRRDGQRDLLAPFIDDDEFSRHLLRLLGSAPIDVELHFLPLVQCQTHNRNQLARAAQGAVVQALGLVETGEVVAAPRVRSCEPAKAITCGMNARKSASNAA
ncbi:lysophospholipid acyltransferase family protein [Halopseudomonas salina]|uniref:lysophospholipid acyltransferase family protein n=1 Tax=Halopseudomonas salina TaxID=1323744 RepID=UPI00123B19A7|nr:1-acyl-sn-glycerol-3-phosphate acyltransferase [Halopseudomonas salina]